MPGALSSERPGKDAYTTRSEGTWGEVQKDTIGVFRGKSLTRNENYGKSATKVGVSTPRPSSMGQPRVATNLRSNGGSKIGRKRK